MIGKSNLDLMSLVQGVNTTSRGIQGLKGGTKQGDFLEIIAQLLEGRGKGEASEGNINSNFNINFSRNINDLLINALSNNFDNSNLEALGKLPFESTDSIVNVLSKLKNNQGLLENTEESENSLDLDSEKEKLIISLLRMFPYGNENLAQVSHLLLESMNSENAVEMNGEIVKASNDSNFIQQYENLAKLKSEVDVKVEELKAQNIDFEKIIKTKPGDNKEIFSKKDSINVENVGKVESQLKGNANEIVSKSEDVRNPLEVQRDMAISFRKAKEAIKNGKISEENAIRSDSVNENVRTPFVLKEESRVIQTETFDVAKQIEEKIGESIKQGDKSFTMKLRPAELGDITVKLQKVDGKLVVEILTASSETSKTINSQMSALRQALVPLNAEIKEATVQPSSQSELMEQFNMSNGGFNNQQFANRQFADSRGNLNDHKNYSVNPVVEENQDQEHVITEFNRGVNMYI